MSARTDEKIAVKTVEEELSTPDVLEEFKTSSPTVHFVDETSASKAELDYNIPPEEKFSSRIDGYDKINEEKNVLDLVQREAHEPRIPVPGGVIPRDMKEEPIVPPTYQHDIQDMTASTDCVNLDEKVKKKTLDLKVVKAVDMSTTAMDDCEQTASPSMQEVTSPEEKPEIPGTTCEDNRSCAPHAITSSPKEEAQQTHKKGEHDDVQVRDKTSSTKTTCNVPDFNNNAENAMQNTSPPVRNQGTDFHS